MTWSSLSHPGRSLLDRQSILRHACFSYHAGGAERKPTARVREKNPEVREHVLASKQMKPNSQLVGKTYRGLEPLRPNLHSQLVQMHRDVSPEHFSSLGLALASRCSTINIASLRDLRLDRVVSAHIFLNRFASLLQLKLAFRHVGINLFNDDRPRDIERRPPLA